jgi:hypothetical protein
MTAKITAPLVVPVPKGWATFMDMEKGMILHYDPKKYNMTLGIMNVLFPSTLRDTDTTISVK